MKSLTVLWAAMSMMVAGPVNDGIPAFRNYPSAAVFRGTRAPIILDSENQRKFRTRIVRASKRPPDFAGEFRIADWGCGTSCVSIAVINLSTGHVYDGPFSTLGYGSPRDYEGGDDWLDYRLASRLLIARGCPEDRDCGTYYYEWRGNGFALLRKVPAPPRR